MVRQPNDCTCAMPEYDVPATAGCDVHGGPGRRYGVGVDDAGPERMWQTDDLQAAYVTAGVESFKGTAVVVEFHDDNSATVIAVYRNGKPE